MEPSLISAFVTGLPPHLKPSIDRLMQRPAADRDDMLAELDAYTQRIDDTARAQPDVDVDLAEAILQSCRTLLHDHWSDLSGDQRRLVQVTCDYYIDADDDASDLESVFGFDDDAEVLNLVADALSHSELKVRV
jgi:hypothetical protein